MAISNISAFNGVGFITASNSYITGPLENFSDDQDGINLEEIEIAAVAKTVNGEMLSWAKAGTTIYNVTITVWPGSPSDLLLGAILSANTATFGSQPAYDAITLVMSFPNKVPSTYTDGVMVKASPSYSSSSEGRIKTKTYTFAFNEYDGV